ncbi:MAG: PQQ-binding-like beta-propeller repeat protein [Thaumarchaeota archaeon]|nr:PQQ-binding-like beta-propeller repeat protein [Nitrososphaerota archaeon]
MKTLHLSLIIGIGITALVILGIAIVSLPPQTSKIVQTKVENQIEPVQDNQNNNKSDAIKQIWNYQVDGEVLSVAASHDASYVAAATRLQEMHTDDNAHQGSVYLFDKSGNQLWKYESNRKMDGVSISGNGQYVVATGYQIASGPAGIYENPAIYLFDKNGTMLWKNEMSGWSTIWGANISYDGSIISTVAQDKVLYLNKDGNLLWSISSKELENATEKTDDQLYGITMTPDGSLLAVRSSNDVFLLNNEGKMLWKFSTQYGNGGWALISKNAKYVFASDAASGSDGNAYLIDASSGSLLWKRQVGGPSLDVGMSDDGSYIVLSTNWQVFIFDTNGKLLGRDNIPSSVTISSDGSFIPSISGTPSGTKVTLLDRIGKILSSDPIEGSVRSMSLSGDSRYLATGNEYNEVHLYEILPISSENQIPLNQETGYNSTNQTLHLTITFPNGKSEFDTAVHQGQTVQIPWNLNVDNNYTTMNLQLSIKSPPNIESWITPTDPYTTINGIPPGDKIITIHPALNIQPGNYTVRITGQGDAVDQSTGWMTDLDGKTLGIINVFVVPHQSQISINIGPTHYEMRSFCVNQEPSGQFCSSGPIYEEIPITIHSNSTQAINLSALNIGQGEWVKFKPEKLVAGPNGTTSKMIVAGYEVPVLRNPLSDKSLIIQAASEHDSTTAILPVRQGEISVLHVQSPIKLGKITTNSNGVNFGESGAVYDPLDNSNGTLPVKLSVLGIMNENNTSLLPLWLSVDIPNPSFTLNATQPYYFMTTVKTNNAPSSGTYIIAIDENIGGLHFIQPEEITIENIRY